MVRRGGVAWHREPLATEQVLAAHPQAFGAGELLLISDANLSLPGLTGRDDPPALCAPHLTPEIIRQLAGDYLAGIAALDDQALRVVDKMPGNYLMLGLIATLLPNARIIHTQRDGRDVAVSCWMTRFQELHWSCDETDLGRRVGGYRRLMDHWRKVLPVEWLEVRYEDTVADLESQARRLVDWVGLPWAPACIEFHKKRTAVQTASSRQVRQPVHSRSVARWKNYEPALAEMFGLCMGRVD